MKKPTLEFKEIAPYLPYALNGIETKKGTIKELLSIDLVSGFRVGDLKEDYFVAMVHFKPILRPLSDYFKTGLNVFSNEDMTYMKLIIEGQTFHYGSISYSTIIWLCKEHYDFQNLIPKGLAIDINTIK